MERHVGHTRRGRQQVRPSCTASSGGPRQVCFVLNSHLPQNGVRVHLGRHRPGRDPERSNADVSLFLQYTSGLLFSKDDFALAANGKLAPLLTCI